MSMFVSRLQQLVAGPRAKRMIRQVLQWHLPVGQWNRPLFNTLYHVHVSVRVSASWTLRFFWYEPLFRSQCRSVGRRFRMEQLPYLFGRGAIEIGDDVQFSGKPSIAFSARHSKTPRLMIGSGTFLGHNCALTVANQIKIGDHCLIAGGVRIADFDGHSLDAAKRRVGVTSTMDRALPVLIDDDVWIGHGAVILKGVHVGHRAIVGARAVVTRDVPADTVVAGNPARIVKSLDEITSLDS